MSIQRRTGGREKMMVPKLVPDQDGFVVVDSTWGTIQPLQIAPGIETVAELEVVAHLEAGLPVIDTRHDAQREQATIPCSRSIPHDQIVERVDELDPTRPTVLFCNGPPCAATPSALHALLDHGYPADMLRYYRGGIHDWMTLGLPIAGSRAVATESPDGQRSA